jgi:hypothetical protein
MSNGPPAPAVVKIVPGSAKCTDDGAGMCSMTAVIKITRTGTETICGGPEMRVNGNVLGDIAEIFGSPVQDPASGLWTHTYTWNYAPVACGAHVVIKASADICVSTVSSEDSGDVPVDCPAC